MQPRVVLAFLLVASLGLTALVAPDTLRPVAEAQAATSSGSFAPAFQPKGGDAWWVQVKVTAGEPVSSVDARVDAGSWKPLTLRSWGDWAATMHAPEGSLVQFRATSQGGAVAESGCYRWLAASAATCPDASGEQPPPSSGGVTFKHGGGNEWWVEATVSPHPSSVEAMDTGGSWRPLTFRSWGVWAGSFHVEPGHAVRFRALHGSTWTESCWFSHPQGQAQDCGSAPPPPPPPSGDVPPVPAGSRRLVAFGDTGTTDHAARNVAGSVQDGATGFIGLGDYAYWDESPSRWRETFDPLLDKGAWLALGNHDQLTAYADLFPQGAAWSVHVHGARVVSVDTTQPMGNGTTQNNFLRRELCGALEPMRILALHATWWLEDGAHHPGWEFPATAGAMDALVQECGVDLVLVSHEHNYQRLMRGEVAYLIVGTGGRSLYPLKGVPEETAAAHSVFGRLLIDLNATGYVARFRTLDGQQLDVFSGGAQAHYEAPPAPPPGTQTVRFDHDGGNEWWVEAIVSPFPSAVEAMDTGGAWTTLTFRSWGVWAGSLRIEPGHEVRFRALVDGRWIESCWHSHPGGVERCSDAPPAAFDATFTGATGNEWWLQVHVEGTRKVVAVDARIDGGSWKPLSLRDWGDWAASHHAPSGSLVEFRATADDGSTDLSGTIRWPAG